MSKLVEASENPKRLNVAFTLTSKVVPPEIGDGAAAAAEGFGRARGIDPEIECYGQSQNSGNERHGRVAVGAQH